MEVIRAMPWKEIIGNLIYFAFVGVALWYLIPRLIREIKLIIRIIKRKNG